MESIQFRQDQITGWNKFYRAGVNKELYDTVLESLEKDMIPSEFMDFKRTLTEKKGDVKFDYVIGSLDKLKAEEPEKFDKWISKNKLTKLFVSLKIDGCSFVARYVDGEYVGCWSRGDGEEGTDWTEKGRFLLPETISALGTVDIRGEFSLTNDAHKDLGYKSRRAGTIGMLNKDGVHQHITCIEAFAYQVLTSDKDILHQFMFLRSHGFEVPKYEIFNVSETIVSDLSLYYTIEKDEVRYDIDGLVISDSLWKNENDKFLPEGKVAFKVNSSGVAANVVGIEWNLSMGRLMKPVVLIEPTEISGTTIQRVTGYNANYIVTNKIKKGVIVYIIKSGEVIPRIVDVRYI